MDDVSKFDRAVFWDARQDGTFFTSGDFKAARDWEAESGIDLAAPHRPIGQNGVSSLTDFDLFVGVTDATRDQRIAYPCDVLSTYNSDAG